MYFNYLYFNYFTTLVGGHPKPHIWNQWPQFAYSLYNFYGATMTIKGSLHGNTHCEAVLGRKFSKSRQKWAKNCGFSGITGFKCLFSNPEKAHPCTEPLHLTYFAWKSVQGPEKNPEKRCRVNIFDAQFCAYGEKKSLEGSWLNFACG